NLVYGDFDNVDMRTQAGHHELQTTFKQITAELTHKFSDDVRLTAMVGRAESNFATPIATTVTFDRQDVQDYVYDYRVGRLPLITFALDPTQPSSWTSINGSSEVRLRPTWVDNVFKQAKAALDVRIADGFHMEVGGDWRKYDFNSLQKRRILGETRTQTLTPAELASLSTLYSGFGRNLNLPAGVATSWLIPDISKFVSQLGIYSNTGIYQVGTIEESNARGSTGSVSEEDKGLYAMWNFNTEAFGIPIRGDFGTRYSHTDQVSTGYAATGSTIELVTARRGYHHFLPSLNLTADIRPNLLLRFGSARTIARASLGLLSPGGNVAVQGVNGSNRSFSTGNPDLKATQSDNLDLSLEWYPQRGAVFAVGLFQKNIGTFAQTLRTSAPYDTLGLPDSLIAGTGAQPTDIFDVTKPVNTNGGRLRGYEINIQQPLSFLPGFLRHFGILANYTHVKSKIDYLTSSTPGAPTVSATLVGLSKDAANGTLYYETERFSVRGSVAYRSGYLTQVPGRNGNFVEGTNATLNVDAQASFNINKHFKVTLEGLNLTDEFNDQYMDYSNRVWVYMHSGRQFYLGVRYGF
ncbi:MAG: TonB-dependent receptor, partial [Alphaproteobacteria bacterium]|nr:TonB-dependent receptor [Alphaproteobacteria bacterium]